MAKFRPSTPSFISASLLFSITAVLLVFGIADYARERSRYHAELENRLRETTGQLAASLALPLWNFQDAQSAKIVENAFANRDISAIIVTDSLSNRIVTGRIRGTDGKTIISETLLPDSKKLVSDDQFILLNGRILGKIAVQATTEHLEMLARHSLQRIVMTIGFLDLIIFLLVGFILKRHISTPLQHIENFAREVSMRNQTTSPPPQEAFLSEMNSVRNSITIMVERLQKQYDALSVSRAQLNEAETRYRDLYENALIGIFRTAVDGRILAANKALADILGYDSPETLMTQITDAPEQLFASDSERTALQAQLGRQDLVVGHRILFRTTRNDVRIGALGLRVVRDTDGSVMHLDGNLQDITERELAETTLRETSTFIQSILDSMPSIVMGIDAELGITHCNSTARQVTGMTTEDLLGTPLTDALPRLQDCRKAITAAVHEAKHVVLANRPHTVDDTSKLETIHVFPVSSKGEKGAVVRIDDVTEQARMEELILQTEKMMSVGGLAAGMAHEINNPLAGILLGVQNIQRRLSPDMDKNTIMANEMGCALNTICQYLEQRGIMKLLHGIQDSGERAARIVSNMLSFARQSQSHHASAHLDALLDKCIELASTDYDLKKKFDFKAIRIIREYANGIPPIVCAASELEQVFLNLLRNAAHALSSPQNRDNEPRITIRLYEKQEDVVVEIEDNGPGIDDRHRRHIFEPFFTTKQPGEGTGLGLSVSYFIITRNHGGTIWLDGEYREGSRFGIALPKNMHALRVLEENGVPSET